MDTEPVVTVASITAAATTLIALLVAFGLPITDTQQNAVLGVIAVAAPLVVIAARRWTWSPKSHREAVEDAARTGQP